VLLVVAIVGVMVLTRRISALPHSTSSGSSEKEDVAA
jgi:hypothetical protein